MSSAQHEPEPETQHQVVATSSASQIVEYLLREPSLCGWCLSKVRRYYEQFDAERNRQLDHQRSALPVITATSDAEPAAFQEIVPPTVITTEDKYGHTQHERRPSRPTTICSECCEIDPNWDEARPRRVMLTAIENIVDELENGETIIGEWSINEGRARRKVKELRSHPDYANRDKDVWAIAIDAALESEPDLSYQSP